MFSGAVSPVHWLILILLVVVLFGAKRLPDVARGIGKSARILKSEVSGLHEDDAKRAEKNADETKAIEASTAGGVASEAGSAKAAEAEPSSAKPAE
jgi:sec-independent protein translocase protein TatA